MVSVVFVQNVARCPKVAETALATISETPLQAVVDQIIEEKKIEDPELVRAALFYFQTLWRFSICYPCGFRSQ